MSLTGRVVFSSGRAADFDIWALDLFSGKLTQLTRGEHFNDYPRWSPRGDLIVFTRISEDSISSIWVMDPDGRNQRRITTGVHCQAPSWHPDGKSVVFSGNAGDRSELSICSVSLDGSDFKVLFDRPGIETAPTVTPDGQSIIFCAENHTGLAIDPLGSTDILEYHISSGELRTIHTHPLHDCDPVCSPSGEWIAFISFRNGTTPEQHSEMMQEYRDIICNGSNAEGRRAMQLMRGLQEDGDIYISDREGKVLRQITEDRRSDHAPCWSPCGNYIMSSCTNMDDPNTDRLRIINAHTGEDVPFSYDREPLEREIQANKFLNKTPLHQLVPDRLERLFLQSSFWGAERHPSWTK